MVALTILLFRYTLKLRTHSKYKVSIEVEIGIQVLYMRLGGIFWDEFLPVPNSDKESSKLNHTFIWCTDKMEPTQNKYRTVLPCVVKLKDHEEIKCVAMVKFYGQDNGSYATGLPFSFFSLEGSEGFVKKGKRNTHKLLFN